MYNTKIKSSVHIKRPRIKSDGWAKLSPTKEKMMKDIKQELDYRVNVDNSSNDQIHDYVMRNPKTDLASLTTTFKEMKSQAELENDTIYQQEILMKNCHRLFPNNASRASELIQMILDDNFQSYFNKFFTKIFRIVNTDYGTGYFPSDVIQVITEEKRKDDAKNEVKANVVADPRNDYLNQNLTAGVFLDGLSYIAIELNKLIPLISNQSTAERYVQMLQKSTALQATMLGYINQQQQGQQQGQAAGTPDPALVAASNALQMNIQQLGQEQADAIAAIQNNQLPNPKFLEQVTKDGLEKLTKRITRSYTPQEKKDGTLDTLLRVNIKAKTTEDLRDYLKSVNINMGKAKKEALQNKLQEVQDNLKDVVGMKKDLADDKYDEYALRNIIFGVEFLQHPGYDLINESKDDLRDLLDEYLNAYLAKLNL